MEERSIAGIVAVAASSLMFLGLLAYLADMSGITTTWIGIQEEAAPNITHSAHRKLLGGSERKEADRMWGDQKCRKGDIVIRQGATSPLASGIPTYTVEVSNMCGSGCDISGIHVSCGWFSSARLINPKVFKRLGYNDCLLNDGKALAVGANLSFQYANTFLYPLAVSSVSCPP
ncbi:TPD1 protein homolog 1-like [Prosopis cineraria]|uniref:TPD1 protein homolog 1-like n=1 Tax=Prosopis cineraria TaxID=364024 RepID=UPI00240F2FFE|nr:TPD1 protein homolog 1-like [Prosopis cineraria]